MEIWVALQRIKRDMYACSLILLVFILAAELHIIQSLEVGGGEVGFSVHNYVQACIQSWLWLYFCVCFFFFSKVVDPEASDLIRNFHYIGTVTYNVRMYHTKWHTWPSGLGWQMWRQALGRNFFSGTTFIVIIFSYPGLTNIFGTYRARWTSVVRNNTRVFLFLMKIWVFLLCSSWA